MHKCDDIWFLLHSKPTTPPQSSDRWESWLSTRRRAPTTTPAPRQPPLDNNGLLSPPPRPSPPSPSTDSPVQLPLEDDRCELAGFGRCAHATLPYWSVALSDLHTPPCLWSCSSWGLSQCDDVSRLWIPVKEDWWEKQLLPSCIDCQAWTDQHHDGFTFGTHSLKKNPCFVRVNTVMSWLLFHARKNDFTR